MLKKILIVVSIIIVWEGRYIIVPEGISGPYIGNWYVAAREISNSPDYFISHYSAMDIHNMLTGSQSIFPEVRAAAV